MSDLFAYTRQELIDLIVRLKQKIKEIKEKNEKDI